MPTLGACHPAGLVMLLHAPAYRSWRIHTALPGKELCCMRTHSRYVILVAVRRWRVGHPVPWVVWHVGRWLCLGLLHGGLLRGVRVPGAFGPGAGREGSLMVGGGGRRRRFTRASRPVPGETGLRRLRCPFQRWWRPGLRWRC